MTVCIALMDQHFATGRGVRKKSHMSKRRGIMVYSVIKRGSPKENRGLIREGTARTLKRFET